jgi:general stress protein 26
MADAAELERDFWKALKSDRTVMLGISTERDPHLWPMTALIEGDEGGPVWFFTAVDTELAELVKGQRRAFFGLVSKDHDVFGTVHGSIVHDLDREVVDRLWNPYVAAWYERGKDDPKLALLRFDPDEAQIWRNGSSLVAGVKALMHIDPKRDYRKNVAEVRLGESGRAH